LSCQEAEISSLAPPIRPAVDPGPPPVAPNLADQTTRLRLTPAAIDGILKLAEIWRLTSAEACALLGDISERSWFRMKKGERAGGSLSQDTLTRVSALIGIFKGLRLLFSEPLSDEWIRCPTSVRSTLGGGRSTLLSKVAFRRCWRFDVISMRFAAGSECGRCPPFSSRSATPSA
jgi:hypothetical protein